MMASDEPVAIDEREQFLTLTHEAMRHLAKQDTFEDANLFEFLDDDYAPRPNPWNNDTLVAAFERIIERYAQEKWGTGYEPYTEPGRGICPPNPDILEKLGLLS